MAPRTITPAESELAQRLLANARRAMAAIADYDQARVDRICQAVGWAGANPDTARTPRQHERRRERHGQPRAAPPRQGARHPARCASPEEHGRHRRDPEKGIVKYAKPAGVICSLIPVTSPYITPIGIAIYAIKCKDAVIFSPHPSSRKTTNETVRLMRAALEGARRSRRRAAVRRAAEHSARQRADVDLRSDDRDRRSRDGQGGLQLRQARLRRRRRQRDDGDRRDRGHQGSGAQHRDQQDQRSRIGLFGRRQSRRRRDDLRRAAAAAAAGGRLSRQRRRRSSSCSGPTGTSRAGAPPTPSPAPPPPSPPKPASHFPPDKTFFLVEEANIGKQYPVLDRKARRRAGRVQVPRLRRCARQGAADFRDRRPRPLVRHLLVQRRPHQPPRADGAGEPHHGAPGAVAARTPAPSPTACR